MPRLRDGYKWRTIPAIYMPKRDARIRLLITGLREEYLQEIHIGDLLAEGYPPGRSVDEDCSEAYEWFTDHWDSINLKRGYGWDTDPKPVVITFERIEGPNGQ